MFKLMTTKFKTGAGRLKIVRAGRRLLRRQDGAAAVEFGLVAAPFLALIFAIMETAIVFFAGQALETAVADSARLILTGQAQTLRLRPGHVQDAGLPEDRSACSTAPTASMSTSRPSRRSATSP